MDMDMLKGFPGCCAIGALRRNVTELWSWELFQIVYDSIKISLLEGFLKPLNTAIENLNPLPLFKSSHISKNSSSEQSRA